MDRLLEISKWHKPIEAGNFSSRHPESWETWNIIQPFIEGEKEHIITSGPFSGKLRVGIRMGDKTLVELAGLPVYSVTREPDETIKIPLEGRDRLVYSIGSLEELRIRVIEESGQS